MQEKMCSEGPKYTVDRRSETAVLKQMTDMEEAYLEVVGEGLYMTLEFCYYSLGREWADPGGTAIPGQPVAKAEQAPDTSPSSKNQFNIVDPRWGSYQILS